MRKLNGFKRWHISSFAGYIDLSKKKVRNNQDSACLDKFSKAKDVNSILITLCESAKDVHIEDLYKKIVWPLYQQYNHAYDAFRFALNDETIITNCDVSEEVKTKLLAILRRRLNTQPMRIKADFELRCHEYEGVDAIKAALLAGEAKSIDKCEVKVIIKLSNDHLFPPPSSLLPVWFPFLIIYVLFKFEIIGSPVYAGCITTQDKALGIEVLNSALKAVEEVILSKKGVYKLRTEVDMNFPFCYFAC